MLKPLTLAALPLLLVCLLPGRAAAQLDNQIADLNRQALDAYQGLDIDNARAKLERAIKLAQRANHVGPTVAQSFLALGLVYVAGMNDQEQGLAAFVNAICMQRDVQLDPLLSTPAVKQVFVQAKNDARAGACGPEAGPPAAEPAPPERPARKPPAPDLAVREEPPPSAVDSALEAETEPECPPGMRCGGKGGDDHDDVGLGGHGFARFFANVQLVGGFSLLRSGMKADSPPPSLYSDQMLKSEVFLVNTVTNPMTGATENRYLFNTESPWVPDADSFDDLEKDGVRGRTQLSDNCAADGRLSGPMAPEVTDARGQPYPQLGPTKYCVRVAKPGFVPGLALRGNLGYWVSDSFAVSLPLRFQFNAGRGSFAHMLIGLRGELAFTPVKRATGTVVSWFFGATYGQIQARPDPPPNSTIAGPYATSGPFGVHTGFNFRIRLHRNFGFVLSPELDLQFPDLLPHADIAGGIETAF